MMIMMMMMVMVMTAADAGDELHDVTTQ